jgi:hypothetical protein
MAKVTAKALVLEITSNPPTYKDSMNAVYCGFCHSCIEVWEHREECMLARLEAVCDGYKRTAKKGS